MADFNSAASYFALIVTVTATGGTSTGLGLTKISLSGCRSSRAFRSAWTVKVSEAFVGAVDRQGTLSLPICDDDRAWWRFRRPGSGGTRNYLLKGGFLWADDFWGEHAWSFWESQLRKVLPSASYPIVDLPLEHPIFHEMLRVDSIPQIPAIDFWAGRRSTSERGADSAVPHVRAISDDRGRIMVLMTHNTDFGDAYEREGDNREYFERFSVPGYAFGVNVVLYDLTH